MGLQDDIAKKKALVEEQVEAKLRPCFDYIMKAMNQEFERESDSMRAQMLLAYVTHSMVKFAAEWAALSVTNGPSDDRIKNFVAGELVGKFMRIMAVRIDAYENDDETSLNEKLKVMAKAEGVN
jgi:hypothetical protein